MISNESLQQKKQSSISSSSTIGSIGEDDHQLWKRNIDYNNNNLSLGPSKFEYSDGSSTDFCRKRKKNRPWEEEDVDPIHRRDQSTFDAIQTNIELQLKGPLPPDWEQCLDLQSGRMYYLNRRTLRKSWDWPIEQKELDLDLNISTLNSNENLINVRSKSSSSSTSRSSYLLGNPSSGDSNMVAVPCLNCHLLVMLCTSSPSCPNCKYVHSLPPLQRPHPTVHILPEPRLQESKPVLETLSLLN